MFWRRNKVLKISQVLRVRRSVKKLFRSFTAKRCRKRELLVMKREKNPHNCWVWPALEGALLDYGRDQLRSEIEFCGHRRVVKGQSGFAKPSSVFTLLVLRPTQRSRGKGGCKKGIGSAVENCLWNCGAAWHSQNSHTHLPTHGTAKNRWLSSINP